MALRDNAASPGTYVLTSSPVKGTFGPEVYDDGYQKYAADSKSRRLTEEERDIPRALPRPLRPVRRRNGDVEMNEINSLTESNLKLHNAYSRSAVANFTSPIGS